MAGGASKIEEKPTVDELILKNQIVTESGESGAYNIGSAKHIDVLIRVGTETGTATIQFHLQVIEPASGAVIETYDGTAITDGDTSDCITVNGLTLGTHVKVTWDNGGGTLDASNYFSGVYCRIVAKR